MLTAWTKLRMIKLINLGFLVNFIKSSRWLMLFKQVFTLRFEQTREIFELIIVAVGFRVVLELLTEEQLHSNCIKVVIRLMTLSDHFCKLLLLTVVVLLYFPRLLINIF